MSQPISEFDELRALLDALCEETITAEQVQRLEQLIVAHPEAEAYYVRYMGLHADMATYFGVLSARSHPPLSEASKFIQHAADHSSPSKEVAGRLSRVVRHRWRMLLWGGVVLSGLAAGLLFLLVTLPKPSEVARTDPPSLEVMDDSVAVLLESAGAEWEGKEVPFQVGTPLSPGWLRLKSGFAHVQFYSGASVVLEGPAEFKLIARNEAFCTRGKLRATVPPHAQGFTVGTPGLDVVDRGTEFGLQVGEGPTAEVHVFQGKVELYDASSDRDAPSRRELTTGQSVRVDGPNTVQEIDFTPNAFQSARDLAGRFEEENRQRQKAWEEASESLRHDPSLLIYYPFQDEPARHHTLHDRSTAKQQPFDGTIVGCSWVTGRWPGKGALEFKSVSDRVRLHVPGSFQSITLAAWVRVDALSNENNSLFMAEGWEVGGVHWQVGEAGKLVLGIKAPTGVPNGHYHAMDVFGSDRLGQWAHIAVVYDRDGGQVTHYVDGRLASVTPVMFDVPLRIGNAEIGNWNMASYRVSQPIRSISGCMDEFVMYSRALTPAQIQQLYEQSRPMF